MASRLEEECASLHRLPTGCQNTGVQVKDGDRYWSRPHLSCLIKTWL